MLRNAIALVSSRKVLIAAFLSIASSTYADQCSENLSIDGSILTAKNYKTWAVVKSTSKLDAFIGAYDYTVQSGFTVLSSNKEIGTISAANSASYKKGKNIPLNVSIQDENEGIRIVVLYTTPAGVFSPEEAIKGHLCRTIDAASQSGDNKSSTKLAEKKTVTQTSPTPEQDRKVTIPADTNAPPNAIGGE